MFNWFKKKVPIETINFEELLPERTIGDIKLPKIRIIDSYNPDKPSIVIIDDSSYVLNIVEEYLEALSITNTTHNILRFYGAYAPFILRDTLVELKKSGLDKIDYAIIDIVLPGKLKENGRYLKMDGIDVAILLNNKYNCKNFLFFSGNAINMHVDFIESKAARYYNYFNSDIRDKIIIKTNKDQEIIQRFAELLNETI